ncbi:hypothetical protein GQ600_21162 [Phytophthora cactorum]|nr:hypothetical protein GQ600_21162 [Phytophthora cactorum]
MMTAIGSSKSFGPAPVW